MAILPLVGWAAPLRSVEALSPYYGEVPEIKVYGESGNLLTENTDYIFDGFFSAKSCAESEKLSEDEVKARPAGAILWVKVTGKIKYEGDLTGSFQIKPMPLVILGAFNKDKGTKVFGSDDPADPIFAVTKVYKKTDATFKTDITKTLGNIFSFKRDPGDDAGDYALEATISGDKAKNYIVESADIYTKLPAEADDPDTKDVNEKLGVQAKFVITPKDFTLGSDDPKVAATVKITIDYSQLIYNGTNQKPGITVYDIDLKKDLKLDKDYTVTYPVGGYANAAEYTITITGKDNYEGTLNTESTKFTIAPRPVFVKPVFKKIYDGTNKLGTLPAKNNGYVTVDEEIPATEGANAGIYTYKFVFQGLIDKQPSDVDFDATALDGKALSTTQKDVTTEPVPFKFVFGTKEVEGKKVPTTINDVFKLTNYTFIDQDGTLEITKRPIKVKAANPEVNYGEDESSKLVLADVGETPGVDAALKNAVADDIKALRFIITVTKAETAETTGDHKGAFKLTPDFLDENAIDTKVGKTTVANLEALGLTLSGDDETAKKNSAKTLLKAIRSDYDLTPDYGYLSYNKATLYLGLDQSKFTLEKAYDGKEISLDDQRAKLKVVGNLEFSGFQGSDKDKAATDTKILDLSELTMEVVKNGAAANTYNLSLSGAKSDFYNISYVNSVYKINPRKLNITTFDQTLINKQAYNLNQKAYKITNTAADEGLADGDDAEKVFKLKTDITVDSKTGNISLTDDGIDAKGYDIDIEDPKGKDSKYANYMITIVKGKAFVLRSDATIITLGDETKDVKEALKTITSATKPVPATVSFSTRDLTEGVWYTLVLPFDITVAEFSQTVGYAIVDKFDETATDGKARFNLYMGNIPANTPFMFKLDGQKNNLNQVVFAGKTIVYDPTNADEDLVQIDEDGNPFVKDGGDNMLVGFYGKKADNKFNAGEYYLNKAGAWKAAEDDKVTLGSGRAKLVLGGNSAREILVEEADGTVTAISCIAADGMAVEADGWYTIGGVKLENAPVEKGVYIRNGKKMVIK